MRYSVAVRFAIKNFDYVSDVSRGDLTGFSEFFELSGLRYSSGRVITNGKF